MDNDVINGLQTKYKDAPLYFDSVLKLINEAVQHIQYIEENTEKSILDKIIQFFNYNKDETILKKIEELIVLKKEEYPFILDEKGEIIPEKKALLIQTIIHILQILRYDWSVPSWIETFKNWLLLYRKNDYLLLQELGITKNKKIIKEIIYKSFLENDPNLKHLLYVSGSDGTPFMNVENLFAELNRINNGIGLDNKNSKEILNKTIDYNEKNIINSQNEENKTLLENKLEEPSTKNENEKKGGKKRIKIKTKKRNKNKKSYKKSYKNPHKNKKTK